MDCSLLQRVHRLYKHSRAMAECALATLEPFLQTAFRAQRVPAPVERLREGVVYWLDAVMAYNTLSGCRPSADGVLADAQLAVLAVKNELVELLDHARPQPDEAEQVARLVRLVQTTAISDVDLICTKTDDFYDGELDDHASHEVRRHLPYCVRCRRRIKTLVSLDIVKG